MNTKSLVRIALFAAITAVLSQIVIPINVVPISLGTFAVYSCSIFLTPKEALLSQLLYITLGLIGLPVYSNFGAGITHLVGFTGGFLISYPIVAFVSCLFRKKSVEKNNIFIFVIGLIISTLICYTMGVLWFSYLTKISIIKALGIVIIPFIIGDILKIVAVTLMSKKVNIKV